MSFFTITAILGVTMAIIVFHYYSPGRKNDVEQAKYDMLNDDDDLVNNPSGQNSQAGQNSQSNNAQNVGQHSNENQSENSQENNHENNQEHGHEQSHEQNK